MGVNAESVSMGRLLSSLLSTLFAGKVLLDTPDFLIHVR
jgi:hypothetical protein